MGGITICPDMSVVLQPSNLISSIIEDNKGNVCFGIFNGVVKYTP